ncbi:MAG: MerR family transcriptional regulator, partial [Promethearchaeota archaeon]
MLLSISKAAMILGVCTNTLRRWHAAGIFLPDGRTLGGPRRYSIERLRSFMRDTAGKRCRKKLDNSESRVIMNGFQNAAIYARVSAAK